MLSKENKKTKLECLYQFLHIPAIITFLSISFLKYVFSYMNTDMNWQKCSAHLTNSHLVWTLLTGAFGRLGDCSCGGNHSLCKPLEEG